MNVEISKPLWSFIVFLLIVSSQSFAVYLPVKSTQEIKFTSKEAFLFNTFDKTRYFNGSIERLQFINSEVNHPDLYYLKTRGLKMDKNNCAIGADQALNLKNSKYLKVESLVIFKSKKGKVCELVIRPVDKKKAGPFRFVHIGFLNARPIALVYVLDNLNYSIAMEAREFWNSLR